MQDNLYRPAKKPKLLPSSLQRLAASSLDSSSANNSLFAPFRLLGLVCNQGTPFALSNEGTKLVTSAGRAYLEWNVKDLRLLGVVNVGVDIQHLHCSSEGKGAVWVSGKSGVQMFVRGEQVNFFHTDDEEQVVGKFIVFGNTLVGLELQGSKMYIWDMGGDNEAQIIDFGPSFKAVNIVHPSTYLNKVVVSSSIGDMSIWNVQTSMLLHTFASSEILPSPAPITSVTQSPAIDILALGFVTGQIIIYDIKQGEILLSLPAAEENSSVCSLAFRDGENTHILAASLSNGTIVIYSLEGKPKLLHTLREAHTGPVSSICFIPGQPILLSSGDDNSLKQWNLDTPDIPRLLKQRSGHSSPPHLLRFYGEDGRALLSAGQDGQLRYVSLVRDTRSTEMSQGSIARSAKKLHVPLDTLRLPSATGLAYSTTRAKDWDDILTCHLGRPFAQTWNSDSKKKGSHTFPNKPTSATVARAVDVTACGNFGLMGSEGEISMWNMQSGQKRRTFRCPSKDIITGVETDSLNKTVIATTASGNVHWFDFHTGELVGSVDLPTGISKTSFRRENGLLATICDDFSIRLIDIETRRTVREFNGFHGRILDIAFSHDSRWLLSTSMDSIIRTFDIPTGNLVDAFRTESVATSVAFSPTGDFLASTHVGSLGIALWTNRAQFIQVSLRSFDEKDIAQLAMPSLRSGEEEEEPVTDALVLKDDGRIEETWGNLKGNNGMNLVTTTAMPKSKWLTLLHLDVIRHRNKPKQPPKAPEKTPFFLPTLPGAEHKFDVSAKTQKGKGGEETESRHLINFMDGIEIELVRRLKAEPEGSDYSDTFDYLKQLSPAAIDREIGGLSDISQLILFFRAILRRLELHLDFEMIQSFLNLTLRSQGDLMVPSPKDSMNMDVDEEDGEQKQSLSKLLQNIREVELEESKRLGQLIGFALGSLKFVKNEPLS